ncbi:MAG: hypothetical protein LBL95_05905 [Deltaproteobacteria bacterium]|nr:hypothetical protein [Deltaproteobacteria bacterium]
MLAHGAVFGPAWFCLSMGTETTGDISKSLTLAEPILGHGQGSACRGRGRQCRASLKPCPGPP